jgi:UDP-N-acetyl-D-mannosaminuronic acid transferase (WecB/TagA/CpsF family)
MDKTMKVDVLGIQTNTDSKDEILEQIQSRLNSNQSTFIVTPYSESLVAAQKDREFRNILNSADFALPDGAGVVWAASFLCNPSSPRQERRIYCNVLLYFHLLTKLKTTSEIKIQKIKLTLKNATSFQSSSG